MNSRKRLFGTIFLVLSITGFLLFPLLGLIVEYLILSPETGWRLFFSTLADPSFLSALQFTLWQALWSVAASLLLGMPLAWLIARHDFRGKKFLYALLTLPMMLPVLFAVLGFVALYGENGFLNSALLRLAQTFGFSLERLHILYSLPGIVLAHAFYNAPIVAKVVGHAWENLGVLEEEAALTLGASPWRVWWTVTRPKLWPAVLSAAALAFVFCFTSFAIPLILGGKPSLVTLEVLIYEEARLYLNFPKAISLALIELFISAFFFLLASWSHAKLDVNLATGRSVKTAAPLTKMRLFLLTLVGSLMVSLLFGPLFAMMLSSLLELLRPTALSGIYDPLPNLLGALGRATRTSLTIATLSSLLATSTATLAAYAVSRLRQRQILDQIALLPAAISGIVIGMGYLKYYRGAVEGGGILGLLSLSLLHSAVNFPFAYEVIAPHCRRITQETLDSSAILGAGMAFRLRALLLPLLRPAIVGGLALTFAFSLGEFTATSMLYSEDLRTVPLFIYQLMSSYRIREASLLGVVFILLSLALFWLLERRSSIVGDNEE